MNSLDLYHLFKNSRIAQVAKPLSKQLRGHDPAAPTHQIIFTPKASATRSNYGLKAALPDKVGASHLVYGNLDNRAGIPDVEKFSSPYHNRMKFQESGVLINGPLHKPNPLFAWDENKTSREAAFSGHDSIQTTFNLGSSATIEDTKAILKENPKLYGEFKKWLTKRAPESIMFKVTSKLDELLKEFISTSDVVKKNHVKLEDLIRNDGKFNTKLQTKCVQGNGGLSYKQKGRVTNTPNGVKRGSIIPGRILQNSDAALGGFVASVNERSTSSQMNYMKRCGDKHQRQFVVPFKVSEAELSRNGGVRMYADAVKVGTWLDELQSESPVARNYVASNPNFGKMNQRRTKDKAVLENLLGLVSKGTN